MKFILTIALLFFVIISCGKNKEIKIVAKNAATGIPYAGLEYRIMSSRTGANGEKYRTEASGTLNENGEAMVNVRQKNRTYSVIVNEPENTCYNKQITQYFDSPYDVNGTFTFEFAECAYLRQNIVNVNCNGASDIFNIRDKYSYTDWSGWSVNILGCYSNTGGDYFAVPTGKRYFEWTVNRSGIITEGSDSIEFQPGEHKELNINY